MKNKNIIYLISALLLILGVWFYWTQIRVTSIRKKCYVEVYDRKNKDNGEWAEGKLWIYAATDDYSSRFWGWHYPQYPTVTSLYDRCLLKKGLQSK